MSKWAACRWKPLLIASNSHIRWPLTWTGEPFDVALSPEVGTWSHLSVWMGQAWTCGFLENHSCSLFTFDLTHRCQILGLPGSCQDSLLAFEVPDQQWKNALHSFLETRRAVLLAHIALSFMSFHLNVATKSVFRTISLLYQRRLQNVKNVSHIYNNSCSLIHIVVFIKCVWGGCLKRIWFYNFRIVLIELLCQVSNLTGGNFSD